MDNREVDETTMNQIFLFKSEIFAKTKSFMIVKTVFSFGNFVVWKYMTLEFCDLDIFENKQKNLVRYTVVFG